MPAPSSFMAGQSSQAVQESFNSVHSIFVTADFIHKIAFRLTCRSAAKSEPEMHFICLASPPRGCLAWWPPLYNSSHCLGKPGRAAGAVVGLILSGDPIHLEASRIRWQATPEVSSEPIRRVRKLLPRKSWGAPGGCAAEV